MAHQSNTKNERIAELKRRLDDTKRQLDAAEAELNVFEQEHADVLDGDNARDDYYTETWAMISSECRDLGDECEAIEDELLALTRTPMQLVNKKTGKPIVRWEEAFYTVDIVTPQRNTWEWDDADDAVNVVPAYRGIVLDEGTLEQRDEAFIHYFDSDGCKCEQEEVELVEVEQK